MKRLKVIIFWSLLVVLAGLSIRSAFYANEANDLAVVYNNTGNGIVVHPVSRPPKDGDVIARVEGGIVIAPGQSHAMRCAGIFEVQMEQKIFRYRVGFIVWDAKEDQEYGGFENRTFQIEPDGRLLVVKPGARLPVSGSIYQPKGHPMVPEQAPDLKDFRIYISPASL